VPVRVKAKGRWRVTIWWRGARKEWIVCGMRADAEAFEARKRVELERGDAHEYRTVPTFFDFCARKYKPHAQLHLKPTTWAIRQFQLATLMQFFGWLKLTDITLEHVERYKSVRRTKKELAVKAVAAGEMREHEAAVAVGVKPATVNGELERFTTVLNFARELGVPCAKLKIRKMRARRRQRVRFWTTIEVQGLFEVCRQEAPDLLPMIFVMAHTGLRKGEALHLTWERVDFERGLLLVWPLDEEDEDNEAGDDDDEAWAPKHDRAREVPFGEAVATVLREQKAKGLSDVSVFPSTRTRRGYASWPKLTFSRVVRKAGLKGGPHTLRHTYASHFLQTQPDLFLLAEVLGHSSTKTTKIYAHLMPGHLARARDAVCIPMTAEAAEPAEPDDGALDGELLH
jgi:integrase